MVSHTMACQKTGWKLRTSKSSVSFGRKNMSKPRSPFSPQNIPSSHFCSYYGDRSGVSEAALEEKDPRAVVAGRHTLWFEAR
jgi:hypothetical protein